MGQVKRQLTNPGHRSLMPVGQIKDMLAARALDLVHRLLPAGSREGHEWTIGGIDGGKGRSMKVNIERSSPRLGVWADFASGETGDALDLVAQVLFAGDLKQAIQWSRAWLGLDGTDPDSLRTTRRAVEQRAAQAVDEDTDKKKRRGSAWHLFLAAQPAIAETPVERYLTETRGIPIRDLGRQPGALRFHPALWNAEAQRKFPAMVALIGDHQGQFMAVHRTWLEVQSDGRVIKAPLAEPKMTFGDYKGGAIRLWRGASGKRLAAAEKAAVVRDARAAPGAAAADPEEFVDAAEGIENALSVAWGFPERRVWSTVALGNLASAILPTSVPGVRWWADNDKAGSKAAAALPRQVERLVEAGKRVQIARPPSEFKDINDYLRGETAC